MKILDKHIMNRRLDILAFTSFAPFTLIFLGLYHIWPLKMEPVDLKIYFIIMGVLIDGSHNYATLYSSYFDASVRSKLSRMDLWAPLGLFIISFCFLSLANKMIFAHLVAYLAFFHFIRQEYGWMKLSNALEPHLPPWQRYVDLCVMYVVTVLPLVWYCKESLKAFNSVKGDLFMIPDNVAETLFFLYWPAALVFFATNAYWAYRTGTLNLTKWLVFFNVLIVWYVARVWLKNFFLGMTIYLLSHGFAYFILVTHRNRLTPTLPWVSKTKIRQGIFIYLSCVLTYVIVMYGLRYNPLSTYLMNTTFKRILGSLAVTPLLLHYYLDAKIWKRRIQA